MSKTTAYLTQLMLDKQVVENHLNMINTTIANIQKLCPHKDENGNCTMIQYAKDHNYDYYECSICLKQEKL